MTFLKVLLSDTSKSENLADFQDLKYPGSVISSGVDPCVILTAECSDMRFTETGVTENLRK